MVTGARALQPTAEFALVAHTEHADQVLCWQEAVQSDVAGVAEGNDELAKIPVDSAADKRVVFQRRDGALNHPQRFEGGCFAFFREEAEARGEVVERAACIDYLRHGFGRRAGLPRAIFSSQAWTSVAA